MLSYNLLIINGLTMVEAAGVEPASEIVVNRETPCSVAFIWISRTVLRSDKIYVALACGSRA